MRSTWVRTAVGILAALSLAVPAEASTVATSTLPRAIDLDQGLYDVLGAGSIDESLGDITDDLRTNLLEAVGPFALPDMGGNATRIFYTPAAETGLEGIVMDIATAQDGDRGLLRRTAVTDDGQVVRMVDLVGQRIDRDANEWRYDLTLADGSSRSWSVKEAAQASACDLYCQMTSALPNQYETAVCLTTGAYVSLVNPGVGGTILANCLLIVSVVLIVTSIVCNVPAVSDFFCFAVSYNAAVVCPGYNYCYMDGFIVDSQRHYSFVLQVNEYWSPVGSNGLPVNRNESHNSTWNLTQSPAIGAELYAYSIVQLPILSLNHRNFDCSPAIGVDMDDVAPDYSSDYEGSLATTSKPQRDAGCATA